ncbi:MAG: hypothetical protein K2N12_09320, partial [Helicobacter sp.]|nr:hypothetical protein [Helicobacter sp.]
KERKETLSPTFLQTIASYKSPLTAFGEGLMKVGETNQKIHDTIWEHDLRQERLERERALHDMQVEAHELKMRRENFQQEQNEKYSSAEREAGIANTRANTWNTSENAQMTKTQRDAFIDDRSRNFFRWYAINENLIDGQTGDILQDGQTEINRLQSIIDSDNTSQAQKVEARDMILKIKEEAGRIQYENRANRQDHINDLWLKEHFNIVYPRDGNKIVYNDTQKYADALRGSFYQVSVKYPETFQKLIRGEIKLDDIQNANEQYEIREACNNFIATFKVPKQYQKAVESIQSLQATLPRLVELEKALTNTKERSRILGQIETKIGIVLGNNNTDQEIIQANIEVLTMTLGRSLMSGVLSNQDLARIDTMIGKSFAENNQVMIKLGTFLASEIDRIKSMTQTMPTIYKKAYFENYLSRADKVLELIKKHQANAGQTGTPKDGSTKNGSVSQI